MFGNINPLRRPLCCLVGAALPFALAACSHPPPPPPPVIVAPPKPVAHRPPPKRPTAQASATEASFVSGPDAPPGQPTSRTVKQPEPAEATEPTRQQTPSLAGLTEGEITRRFGRPTAVRKTPSALVWTYQDQACTLDLFLFTDMRSGEQKVLTYQLGGNGRDVLGDRGCLERLTANGKTG
jgi:hypothetical protein